MADWCENNAIDHYVNSDRGWFDIGHHFVDPFPPYHSFGYLTQEHVLAAMGTPVNFTWDSTVVAQKFGATHDGFHGGFLDAIAYLLDNGVKVHLMYGDRDYACNWLGGESASLAVPYSRQTDFAASPYGVFWTPEGLSGITRQLGNFSFTRVFQAGHMVPSYQPVAAYELFNRATFGLDIGLGILPVHDDLENDTGGDSIHRWVQNEPPPIPEPRCYVLMPSTCPTEVWMKVATGMAIVKDFYVVGFKDDEEPSETRDHKTPQIEDEL